MTLRVVIMARWPEPGRCKTRLIPAVGPEGAARVHRLLAEKTVSVVRASGLNFELWGTGAPETDFVSWLGSHTYKGQPDGDLGAKLEAASEPYPVLFLGTDAPDLTPELLLDAEKALGTTDCVIGPAEDGGYWTLGLRGPCPDIFSDISWGTEAVFAQTMTRIRAAGRRAYVLPELADLDRPEDLSRWPEYQR
ncbi:MAG: TIGR04282 family arsenosugar biosynthesis glycosyltransferase [Pseudomonadota bacterium]